MIYIIKNVEKNIIHCLSESEYHKFCLSNRLDKIKLKKTCKNPNVYNGDDKRNEHKGFSMMNITDDNGGSLKPNIEVDFSDLKNVIDGLLSAHEKKFITKLDVPENIVAEDKNTYQALLFADYHYPYFNIALDKIFKQFLKDNKFDEIVDMGDGVDAGAIGKHLNLEDDKMDLYSELMGYKDFLKQVKELSNNTRLVVLEDNHYHNRLKRYIAENPAMQNMIKDIDFPYDEKIPFGKPYFPLQQYGQKIIGAIHGIYANDHFAKKLTIDYPTSMIQAHTHTIQQYHNNNGKSGYSIPAMCKPDMAYLFNRPNRWRFGFAVLTFLKNENVYKLDILEMKNGCIVYNNKIYKGE